MKLVLQRSTETPLSTIGDLSIDGVHQVFTLERAGEQFPSDYHRIPAGPYEIVLYDSPHFGRKMPMLKGLEGPIEIHWGNVPGASHGCILVGIEKGEDAVYHSRDAFDFLFPQIFRAVNAEGCFIVILDPPGDNGDNVQQAVAEE